MYKTIYVPVDNSDHSNMAVELGVQFAKPSVPRLWEAMSMPPKCMTSDLSKWKQVFLKSITMKKSWIVKGKFMIPLITRGLQIITDSIWILWIKNAPRPIFLWSDGL